MSDYHIAPLGETYLVGGAVRDLLLGLDVNEWDFVVVGGTEEAMLGAGFQRVGKDFPVFLHPQTQHEYALARTEKKIGRGYGGFSYDHKDVSLVDDLSRRDLTVNAMAVKVGVCDRVYEDLINKVNSGKDIIDPWGGYDDLKNKILRHVSDAFVEDPLRVLRAARFFARFSFDGFRLHPDTICLMKEIVKTGELQFLSPERVWQETIKALMLENPKDYFSILKECDGLYFFPPMQSDRVFRSSMKQLEHAVCYNDPLNTRVASMTKYWTEQEITEVATKLNWSKSTRELAILTARYVDIVKKIKIIRKGEGDEQDTENNGSIERSRCYAPTREV